MHYGTFFRDAITSVVGYHEIALEAGGAFHSTKASGLNFRQLLGASGTAFSKISKNRATARGIPKFSKFFPPKFSFHSTLLPEFLEFSVEWLAFRKFNSFRNFWKLFREFSVPFAAVFKFLEVLVEWKALHMKEINA